MSDIIQPGGSADIPFAQPLTTPIKRRSFFMYAGATAGATALALAGCSDDTETVAPTLLAGNSVNTDGSINLGSGDIGVLNLAYALEQLEADFYARVAAGSILTGTELAYFQQIAKHEAIHRDFLKAAITRDASTQLLRNLTPKYPVGTFDSRTFILATAKAFEDLGVAAYNGAAKLIKTPAYLAIAGQLVSVEARHAAYVRGLLSTGTFAEDGNANTSVDAYALDVSLTPAAVITAVQPFITELLSATTVGTTL
jgi:rubrerythrin